LSYTPAADEKEWVRTLMIDDSTGAGIIELPEIKSVKKSKAQITYTIPNKQLKEILAHNKKIMIYFTSIPSDPAKAALVRIRPVHICTIGLEQ
ncbi:MAG TPA: hypothetical protein VGO58_20450, partial [Chitinophagaceae bacterium]|nr:hypothetical protein [Chitinophagaceae bacterium]